MEIDLGILPDRKFTKAELKLKRNTTTIAEIMKAYIEWFGVRDNGRQKEFCEKYWEKVLSLAIDKGERVVLPHNLGYIQVLKHRLQNVKDHVEHIKKFGYVDYSLVWIKHPLFVHHQFFQTTEIHNRIKENVLKGVSYLSDYVDGDFYVS